MTTVADIVSVVVLCVYAIAIATSPVWAAWLVDRNDDPSARG